MVRVWNDKTQGVQSHDFFVAFAANIKGVLSPIDSDDGAMIP